MFSHRNIFSFYGIIFSFTYDNSIRFLASDCFELGRQSYHNRDYYHTALWMQEAMDRLQEEQNVTTTSKPDILEYLAFSTYMQGSDSKLWMHVDVLHGAKKFLKRHSTLRSTFLVTRIIYVIPSLSSFQVMSPAL